MLQCTKGWLDFLKDILIWPGQNRAATGPGQLKRPTFMGC